MTVVPSVAGRAESRVFRLPRGMADFGRRGFRLDRPRHRALLETHARSFLTGFNTAVRHWRDPHPVLAAVPAEERGFAYEGAAMHAALRDRLTFGRTHAFERLLDGSGTDFVHLIHVGYGWAFVPSRLPLPVPIPGTPLLRWLALDGAGFAQVFFGGLRALSRLSRQRPSERWRTRLAGCGRALWFVESGDPAGVTVEIRRAAAAAQPDLWSGVGLASCYAGGADAVTLTELVRLSGPAAAHFRQGCVFAIAARHRSGTVPAHTTAACRTLFATSPGEVAAWTDEAAAGLETAEIADYARWRARLRARSTAGA